MGTQGMPSRFTPRSEWGFMGRSAEKVAASKIKRHLQIDEVDINKNWKDIEDEYLKFNS